MNGRKRLSWEQTAIKLAFNIADYRSEDKNHQVGAVAIKHNNNILLGYNGAPPGKDIDWSDREYKRKIVRHAEFNVLNSLMPGEVKILAVTHLPCLECLKIIAAKEIKIVYYSLCLDYYKPEEVLDMAKELGVNLIQINEN